MLLSGLTSRAGPSHDLLQAARRFDVIFVLSEGHFQELADVLGYPAVLRLGAPASSRHRSPSGRPQNFTGSPNSTNGSQVWTGRLVWPSCPDPKDWYLLDLLVTSGAEGLVTKDRHLLRMAERVGLPVLTPAELGARGLI